MPLLLVKKASQVLMLLNQIFVMVLVKKLFLGIVIRAEMDQAYLLSQHHFLVLLFLWGIIAINFTSGQVLGERR